MKYVAETGYHDVPPGVDVLTVTETKHNDQVVFTSPVPARGFNEVQIEGSADMRRNQLTDPSYILFLDDPDYDKLRLRRAYTLTKHTDLSVSDDDVKRLQSFVNNRHDGTVKHPHGGVFPSITEDDLTRVLTYVVLPTAIESAVNESETLAEKLAVLRQWRLEEAPKATPPEYFVAIEVGDKGVEVKTLPYVTAYLSIDGDNWGAYPADGTGSIKVFPDVFPSGLGYVTLRAEVTNDNGETQYVEQLVHS